jgi:DNA repair exonuclease SbcCD ATPase subunit
MKITKVIFENYKGLRKISDENNVFKIEFDAENLNIISGQNGLGKSTILSNSHPFIEDLSDTTASTTSYITSPGSKKCYFEISEIKYMTKVEFTNNNESPQTKAALYKLNETTGEYSIQPGYESKKATTFKDKMSNWLGDIRQISKTTFMGQAANGILDSKPKQRMNLIASLAPNTDIYNSKIVHYGEIEKKTKILYTDISERLSKLEDKIVAEEAKNPKKIPPPSFEELETIREDIVKQKNLFEKAFDLKSKRAILESSISTLESRQKEIETKDVAKSQNIKSTSLREFPKENELKPVLSKEEKANFNKKITDLKALVSESEYLTKQKVELEERVKQIKKEDKEVDFPKMLPMPKLKTKEEVLEITNAGKEKKAHLEKLVALRNKIAEFKKLEGTVKEVCFVENIEYKEALEKKDLNAKIISSWDEGLSALQTNLKKALVAIAAFYKLFSVLIAKDAEKAGADFQKFKDEINSIQISDSEYTRAEYEKAKNANLILKTNALKYKETDLSSKEMSHKLEYYEMKRESMEGSIKSNPDIENEIGKLESELELLREELNEADIKKDCQIIESINVQRGIYSKSEKRLVLIEEKLAFYKKAEVLRELSEIEGKADDTEEVRYNYEITSMNELRDSYVKNEVLLAEKGERLKAEFSKKVSDPEIHRERLEGLESKLKEMEHYKGLNDLMIPLKEEFEKTELRKEELSVEKKISNKLKLYSGNAKNAIISKFMAELTDTANELISSSENSTIDLLLSIESNGQRFDIMAHQPGLDSQDVSTLSGAEKSVVVRAISIALAKSSSDLYDIICMDEADSALSSSNKVAFTDSVEKIMETFPQVLLITHSAQIISELDGNVIELKRN